MNEVLNGFSFYIILPLASPFSILESFSASQHSTAVTDAPNDQLIERRGFFRGMNRAHSSEIFIENQLAPFLLARVVVHQGGACNRAKKNCHIVSK